MKKSWRTYPGFVVSEILWVGIAAELFKGRPVGHSMAHCIPVQARPINFTITA